MQMQKAYIEIRDIKPALAILSFEGGTVEWFVQQSPLSAMKFALLLQP